MKDHISKEIDKFLEEEAKDKYTFISYENKKDYYSLLILKSIYDKLCEVADTKHTKETN